MSDIKSIKVSESHLIGQIRSLEEDKEDEKNLTIQVVATTEHPVPRMDWTSGEVFNEILDVSSKSMRTDRLKKGIAVLNSHNSHDLSNVLGRTTDFRIENKELILDLRMSKRKEIEPIIQDIKDGILSSVSIGYKVFSFDEDSENSSKDVRALRATDWEPHEVSLVPVPADPGANVRQYDVSVLMSHNLEKTQMSEEKKVDNEELSVKSNEAEKDVAPAAPAVDVAALQISARKLEAERQSEIRSSCRSLGLDSKFSDELCSNVELDVNEARKLMIAQSAKSEKAVAGHVSITDHNPVDNAKRGLEDVLQARVTGDSSKLDCNAKRFTGGMHSVGQMMSEYLKAHNPLEDFSKMSVPQLAQRALTTSDFPLLLADSANKMLKTRMQLEEHTYDAIVHRVPLSNFHINSSIDFQSNFRLEETSRSVTPERGASKYGTGAEVQETIQLKKYTAELEISLESLINDDLRAFDSISTDAAEGISELEAQLVYKDIILDNVALASTNSLFDSSNHSNDHTSNALSTDGAVNVVRTSMMQQVNINGNFVKMEPNILLVPPALFKDGISHTSVLSQMNLSAEVAKNFISKDLVLISEARIGSIATGGSDTIWYMISTKSPNRMIQLSTLNDTRGLTQAISVKQVSNEGITYKVFHAVAAAPMDFRAYARSAA